ncbi:hypothetical protein V8D89_000941 [Ganoderma adspersum]
MRHPLVLLHWGLHLSSQRLVLPFPQRLCSAPAASTSTTTPALHPCHCTSTGTIVGITIAAASTASVLTMLVLLYLLRRNGRSASTKPARPMTDPFPTSKNSNPSSSSIRDTVILISPDRETRPASIDAAVPRSSDSHYSQDSSSTCPRPPSPFLPSSHFFPSEYSLIPPLLVPSPSSLAVAESESRQRALNLSPPPPPAPSRSYMYRDAGSADAWRGVPSERVPLASVSAIGTGSFAGSDRRVLPSVVEVDGDADLVALALPGMIPVHSASARTAALSPLHGRGR